MSISGGNLATTLKSMAMNSTIAVYATNGNRNPVIPMRELIERCIALRPAGTVLHCRQPCSPRAG